MGGKGDRQRRLTERNGKEDELMTRIRVLRKQQKENVFRIIIKQSVNGNLNFGWS